ncbi:hypothetical protein D9M70_495490 [compost metagenome]
MLGVLARLFLDLLDLGRMQSQALHPEVVDLCFFISSCLGGLGLRPEIEQVQELTGAAICQVQHRDRSRCFNCNLRNTGDDVFRAAGSHLVERAGHGVDLADHAIGNAGELVECTDRQQDGVRKLGHGAAKGIRQLRCLGRELG